MKQKPLFTDPPTLQAITHFFSERHASGKEAEMFYLFWEMKSWTNKEGNRLVDWKAAARRWIRDVLIFQKEQSVVIDLNIIAQ